MPRTLYFFSKIREGLVSFMKNHDFFCERAENEYKKYIQFHLSNTFVKNRILQLTTNGSTPVHCLLMILYLCNL